ncbi:MAG: hypothetical protein IE880_01195, partial [Epsilonproteobacteria bacterium]|nr:hypothetical protein [Campylobacterota bacterium]
MGFYDKKEIEKKVKNLYDNGSVFLAYMRNETLFPYTIALKKLTQNDIVLHLSILQKEIASIQYLPLVYKEFQYKSIGT